MPFTNSKIVDSAGGGSTFPYNRTHRRWSPSWGWTITPYSSTQPSTYKPNRWYNYKQWNRTPGYKALLASQGFLPTLEFDLWEWSQNYSPNIGVTWRNRLPAEYDWWDEPTYHRLIVLPSQVVGSGWPTSSELTNLRTDSQHKVLGKARDMKVNLPVMFGEGRKTVNMIADTAMRLGNAYLSFLRKEWKKAAKYLGIKEPAKGAAQHWLAYQYGWGPLLSDAEGLSELASEQLDTYQQRPPRFTVVAQAQIRRGLSYKVTNGFSGYGEGSTNYKGEVVVKARSGLKLEIVFRDSSLLAQLGVSSLTDGLLLAWELVPFSFVFDWFVKIGQYLESASALSGLRVVSGYTRHEIQSKGLTGYSDVSPASTYQLEKGRLDPIQGHERKYYRQNYMGAQPSITIYGLDALGDSPKRLTSAASLFRVLCMGDRARGAYRP